MARRADRQRARRPLLRLLPSLPRRFTRCCDCCCRRCLDCSRRCCDSCCNRRRCRFTCNRQRRDHLHNFQNSGHGCCKATDRVVTALLLPLPPRQPHEVLNYEGGFGWIRRAGRLAAGSAASGGRQLATGDRTRAGQRGPIGCIRAGGAGGAGGREWCPRERSPRFAAAVGTGKWPVARRIQVARRVEQPWHQRDRHPVNEHELVADAPRLVIVQDVLPPVPDDVLRRVILRPFLIIWENSFSDNRALALRLLCSSLMSCTCISPV